MKEIRFLLLGILILLNLPLLDAQTSVPTLDRLDHGTAYFTNGDSLPLPSLKGREYQLVLMVFHAEEDTIGLDPGLSTPGRYRAINLQKLFRDVPFAGFYTTPFRKNILSLQPLLDAKNGKTSFYDQADIKALVKKIEVLYPEPAIVMVHPETLSDLVNQLSALNLKPEQCQSQPDMLLLLERSTTSKPRIHFLHYKSQ